MSTDFNIKPVGAPVAAPVAQQQLGLFQAAADDVLRERLRAIDVNQTTPLDALRLLARQRRQPIGIGAKHGVSARFSR